MSNSVIGKDNQTPFIPKKKERKITLGISKIIPRIIDMKNPVLGLSVALKMVATTILNPEKIKPI